MNAPVSLPSVALRNLCRLQYGNGFTLWHYGAESLHDVLMPGFWTGATSVKRGDHILVSAPDGGATLYVGGMGVRVMVSVGG